MKKDFIKFKSNISPEKLKYLSDEITTKLNAINPELDPIEFERSFNFSLTMKLLEEYHEWLNK